MTSDARFKPVQPAGATELPPRTADNDADAFTCRTTTTTWLPDAISICDRAIGQFPDDATLHLARALARNKAGDKPGAQADLDRACALGTAAACGIRF